MKKTLQECKEIVAKDAGYPNWENVIENFFGTEYFTDLANKMYYEQSEWISVEDVLPPLNTEVLVWVDDTYLDIAQLYQWSREEIRWDTYNEGDVTHWQPLPNPPQK